MPTQTSEAARTRNLQVENGTATIYLYGDIWGGDARWLAAELSDAGKLDHIDVRINSAGGVIPEGLGIYNLLRQNAATVHTYNDGMAWSTASWIMQAGDKRFVADNSLLFVHDPAIYLDFWGHTDASELDDIAEEVEAFKKVLDLQKQQIVTTYANRSGADRATVEKWMTDETWFDADAAVAANLADEVIEGKTTDNRATLDEIGRRFDNVPAWIAKRLGNSATPTIKDEPMADDPKVDTEPKAANLAELKTACPGAGNDFLIAQMENNATCSQAVAAFMLDQQTQLTATRKELDAANKRADDAAKKAEDNATPPGADPVPNGEGGDGPAMSARNARDELETITRKLMKERGWNRGRAWGKAIKDNPELCNAIKQPAI